MYQKLFNETLTRLRLVLVATGNQDLMKAVAKIMFDFSDSLLEYNLIKDEEKNMKKEISDIFSKHYSRMITDLSQIVGFTPVMKVVISNSMRCLEDDILEKKKKENGNRRRFENQNENQFENQNDNQFENTKE